MNVSHLVQASSFSNYAGAFSRAMSTSVSQWSGVILATSCTALVGLGMYRFSQNSQQQHIGQDPDFEKVKARVSSAYLYVFGGLALTAATAVLTHASGLSRKILENSYLCVPAALLLSIGGLVTTMLTDKENIKVKHIALAVFNTGMGVMLSPLGFLPRSVVTQAAFITLGIGSLLTFTAHMAPDKQFLEWEGPLMTALTTLSIAGFVAFFFPNTAFAYGVDRASLYGGLLIFSGLFLSSTQKLVDEAEKQNDNVFDPINSSMNLYLDTLNIFVRIVRILAENQKKED